jgi:hypothetical protein
MSALVLQLLLLLLPLVEQRFGSCLGRLTCVEVSWFCTARQLGSPLGACQSIWALGPMIVA